MNGGTGVCTSPILFPSSSNIENSPLHSGLNFQLLTKTNIKQLTGLIASGVPNFSKLLDTFDFQLLYLVFAILQPYENRHVE